MNAKQGEVEKWVSKAEEDRFAVVSLFKLEGRPASVVCFHAQQCAEKYLKALLIHGEVNFGRTHDLLELVGRLPATAEPAEGFVDAMRVLNAFSVLPRYPDWEPSESDISAAVEAMELARSFVRKQLGLPPD
ncbi:MAG: hypothetical protein B1H03_05115 [Planctomycetales bacterium 4484_113]|nr:MAG: hypothetical protein B1H03_05115 [Planctomycetales bacterium 4484_113]